VRASDPRRGGVTRPSGGRGPEPSRQRPVGGASPSINLLCRPVRMAIHARTVLPDTLHVDLLHIRADTGIPITELLLQGAILIARWHGRGGDQPEPTPPRGMGGQKR
jgi:hypothetical protein